MNFKNNLSTRLLVVFVFLFLIPFINANAIMVSFDTRGGSFVEEQFVEEGDKVTRPEDPVRDGSIFGGWYQDDTYNIEFLFDDYIVENFNFTIFAKWIEIIPSGRLEITLPVAGAHPNHNWQSEDNTFTVSNVNYYLGDTFLNDDYEFLPNTAYDIYVTILPNDGYEIDTEHATFTINYHQAEYYGQSGRASVYKITHEIPENGVTRIQTDVGGAFFQNKLINFSSEESDEDLQVVRVINTGSTAVTISHTSPTGNGPFGTYWYDSETVLNPNDYIDITLRLAGNSPYASTPGHYEGEYIFTATNVEDNTDTYNLYLPTWVSLFEYKENTITFNSNGGSEVPEGHANTGETVNRPQNPIKGSEALEGWYYDPELTMYFDFENNQVWDDMTLYANWVEGVTITFVTDGDSIDPMIVPKGIPMWELAMNLNPTYSENELMYLSGVKLNSLDNEPLTDEQVGSLTIDSDTVVYLLWDEKEVINELKLNMDTNVAGWSVGKYFNEENDRWEPAGPVPSVFPLWNENGYGVDYQEFLDGEELYVGTLESGTEYYARGIIFLWGNEYGFSNNILEHISVENATLLNAEFLEDGRITFEIKFTATDGYYGPSHPDEVTIEFNTNGASPIAADTFAWEEGTILPNPERENYFFGGWANYDEENWIVDWFPGGEEVHPNYDMTLNAIWYPIENKITELNIVLESPVNGDVVGQVERHDDWGSWYEPDHFPDVWVDEVDPPYHVRSARWVLGTCPTEDSSACVEDFIGTFETGEYYYANIQIQTDDNHYITDDILEHILVNGVAPEEVYAVYSYTDTVFVAKVKAVKSNYIVRFMDGENELFNRDIRYNEVVQEPNPAPENGIYYVDGWYQDETLNIPYNFETRVKTDFDLFAKWALNTNALGIIRIGGNAQHIAACDGCNSVTVTYEFGTMTITGTDLYASAVLDNNQYVIRGLGQINVIVTGDNVRIMYEGEDVGTNFGETLTAGNEIRLDAEVHVNEQLINNDYEDITFNITWNKSFVNSKINNIEIMEESQDFESESFVYTNLVVENAGYTASDKTNTFTFETRFGDHQVTEFTINGVVYSEDSEDVEVTNEGRWLITVRGAETYTISGTGNEEIAQPRTIIWANVDANTEADEYAEDMLVEHGTVKIVGVYDDDIKVSNGTEANNDGMGYAVVEPGDEVVFEFTPEYGYQLTGILVNGQMVSAEAAMNQYSFTMPDANVHFQAVFKKTEDIVASNTDKVKSGEITLGSNLEGGSAKLTITDVELSSDKIKGFENAAGNNTITSYLDIDLYNIFYKGKDDENDVWSNKIDELEKEATITIKLADDVDVANVVLVHNIHDGDTYEIIEIESYDQENHTITFKTKSFSSYAIALKSSTTTTTPEITTTTNTTNVPKTNDNIITYISIMLVSGFSLTGLLVYYRKNKRNEA